MPTIELARTLERAGVPYETLPHERTDTALAEAVALGARPEEVAKTIVVRTPHGNVRAVLPAGERLDLRKLGRVIGVQRQELQLLTEGDLARQYEEFEPGAVPPVGGRADYVVLDSRLADRESVLFEAGTHDESVRIEPAAIVRLTVSDVADICSD